MRRLLLSLLAAGGLLALTSCSAPNPDITFFSSGSSVSAAPIQYCDVTALTCAANGSATVSLPVIAGKPMQISAPNEVASTPWQVAARYRGPNGAEYVACSPLFKPGERYAYTVNPPGAGDALVLIEVYQVSATLVQLPNGDLVTPARGTWVLTAGAGSGQVLPKAGDNLCASAG